MGFIDGFERGVLFRLTRALTMLFILAVLLGVLASGFMIFLITNNKQPTSVKATDVIESLKPQPRNSDNTEQTYALAPEGDPLAALKIPFSLQKHLDYNNVATIRNWLKSVPDDKQAEALVEMGEVAAKADASDITFTDAMNKYYDMKKETLNQDEKDQASQRISIFALMGLMVAGVIVIAQLSLILVMLAVERNTRTTPL